MFFPDPIFFTDHDQKGTGSPAKKLAFLTLSRESGEE
jgi:hypothetical protein